MAVMKIAIAGVSHETNTYCSKPTPLEAFRVRRRGDAELAQRSAFTKPLQDEAERLGAEVVTVYMAGTAPSGTIEAAAWRTLKTDLLADLAAELPVDGVVLALHGAGAVEGEDDLEGDLAEAVRALVGPEVPITAFFDLHGNATQRMADALDATLPCHEYPHVDLLERGIEALQLIAKIRAGEIKKPVTHVETLPMLLQPSDTFSGPMTKVNEFCREVETRPGILECGLFHGFPYCDTPLVGVHVIVSTDGDRELARATALEVAGFIWENRETLRQRSLTSAEAIAKALEVEGLPVVINETSDNPGGGAPGDGTHLLRALLEAKVESCCFGFICDPEVLDQATKAGVGSTIDVRLGGKTDELHGAPIEASAYVKTLTDGKYQGRDRYKFPGELGKSARLVIEGIDVIVTDRPGQVADSGVFLLHGIDVDAYKIVALKSSNHFRAGFEDRAKAIVTADAPGLTTINIEVFPRSRTPRPIWPLDADATWAPAAAIRSENAPVGAR
jgi:microcystin degradation protein MlrC